MSNEPSPIISRVLPDGTLLEAIYDGIGARTALAFAEPGGSVGVVPQFEGPDGTRYIPYSPQNNLLTTGCVLLPSAVGELGDKGELIRLIQGYLCRYVDMSPTYVELASYYVLLSWTYDAFAEVPYLRFRGGPGTGKTRALLALGSICYKPFFASGASTVSPIFHILDSFRGTLVLDEADFRYSEMTGELTKVLNNGTVNGLPVLRTMTNRHRELNPQAFRVFGPKILAMRERFSDDALESRFFTENMGRRPASHIPIHTPESLKHEALELRNRLLSWRLQCRHTVGPAPSVAIARADARLNQMALPLLSLIDDEQTRIRIAGYLAGEAQHQRRQGLETSETLALRALLEVIAVADAPLVRVADVTARFNQFASGKFDFPLNNKAVGHILRTKLGISTAKFHGVYGIGQEEWERARVLADRFGVPHTLPTSASVSTAPPYEAEDFPACTETA